MLTAAVTQKTLMTGSDGLMFVCSWEKGNRVTDWHFRSYPGRTGSIIGIYRADFCKSFQGRAAETNTSITVWLTAPFPGCNLSRRRSNLRYEILSLIFHQEVLSVSEGKWDTRCDDRGGKKTSNSCAHLSRWSHVSPSLRVEMVQIGFCRM